MRHLVSVIAATGLLAACNGGGESSSASATASASEGAEAPDTAATTEGASATASASEDASATPGATASPATSATSESHSNGALSISEETDDYLFEYAYPAAAGNIPELAALLDKRLERNKAELAEQSAEARDEARDNGFPYNKHSYSAEWKVVANLPDWLSLSSEIATYSGGAHGNYGYGSLVWNKQDKRAIKALDMFTSAAALDEALHDRLCAALNAERAKRRGPDTPEMGVDEFEQCVPVSDATVLVGSAGKKRFDRVGVIYGPYAAGPYAEGSYEFTLPVTKAVLETVKPEYRDAFAARN